VRVPASVTGRSRIRSNGTPTRRLSRVRGANFSVGRGDREYSLSAARFVVLAARLSATPRTVRSASLRKYALNLLNGSADMIMRDGTNGDYEIYDIGSNAILAAYPLGQIGLEWQV
jgi:hypothetical protein